MTAPDEMKMDENIDLEIYEKEKRLIAKLAAKDALLDEAEKFLMLAEMGGEMFCLACKEGNYGDAPEHKEDCKLKIFLAKLRAGRDAMSQCNEP